MRLPIPILCCLALAACASTSEGKLPVCDGKHRRPANPYGSVLLPKGDAAAPAPKAPGNVSVLPGEHGSCA